MIYSIHHLACQTDREERRKIYFLFTKNRHNNITDLEIPILGIALSMMMRAKIRSYPGALLCQN
jgi:hypothetical protein